MIGASDFVKSLTKRGFIFYSGVPCSFLKPLINFIISHKELVYIAAPNEAEAVALCSGAVIAGKKSVVMLQNSGLGNAVNPLTSLSHIFRIPVLLIITLRGEPGANDEPQHELMGRITQKMLETMGIPWDFFPEDKGKIEDVLNKAQAYMDRESLPYALIMRGNSVVAYEPCDVKEANIRKISGTIQNTGLIKRSLITRMDMLRSLIKYTPIDKTAVIATTGYTGRELYAIEDRVNQLYMVGSMGCALPLGLGLALNIRKKRVVVLDGDGALLMHLGAMALVGRYGKGNLTHIVFDNGSYLSTGGQKTLADNINFSKIARVCGYGRVGSINTLDSFEEFLRRDKEGKDSFIHLKINTETFNKLPRPEIKPQEVLLRFKKSLAIEGKSK